MHPVSIIFDVLGIGLRDVAFVVVLLVTTGWWWLLGPGVVVALGAATLRWSRTTWQVNGNYVIVERGVLERAHRSVPVDRIQQIDVIRNLRHQMLGVATLRIETGGGTEGSEVELAVIPAAEAAVVREALLVARDRQATTGAGAGNGGDPSPGTPGVPDDRFREVPLVHLGLRRLALAGLAGPQLLALPVALAWVLALADDLPARWRPDLPAQAPVAAAPVLALAILAVVAAWAVAAMVAGVITHHDLTLSLVGDEVRLRQGLLNRREVGVPLHRVQAVVVRQHPVLGAAGLVGLRLHSGGGRSGQDAAELAVPTLDRTELDAVLAHVLPEAVPLPELIGAPRRALPRQVLRHSTGLGSLAAVIVAVLEPSIFAVARAATVGGLFGAGVGVLAWRGLGAAISPRLVAGRSGVLILRTVLVPTRRAQSASMRASWFQRRRRLATAHVDVASLRARAGLWDRDPTDGEAALRAVAAHARTLRDPATRLGRPPAPVP